VLGAIRFVPQPRLWYVLYGRAALLSKGSDFSNPTAARPLPKHHFFDADIFALKGFEDGLPPNDGGRVIFR